MGKEGGAPRSETARRRAERAWAGQVPQPTPSVAPSGRRLLGALLACACLGAGALLAHTQPFLLRRLAISGLQQASAAEIRADLELPAGAYTWQLRPWTLTRRLRRDPLIASARVGYLGLDGLSITVREREPVVGFLQSGTLWEVDAAGTVLRGLAASSTRGPVTIPGLGVPIAVVVGAQLGTVAPGERISAPGPLQAMQVAEALGGSVTTTAGTVVVSGNRIGVLTLGGIPVDFGDGSAARRKAQILQGILQAIGGQGAEVTAIDLSSVITPSLTLRPGSPPLTMNGVVTSG